MVKIDSNLNIPEQQQPQRSEQVGAAAQEHAKAQAQRGVEPGRPAQSGAEISQQARKAAELRGQLDGVPEVRQERVQALQKSLSEGRFDVTNRQIADALQGELSGRGPFQE